MPVQKTVGMLLCSLTLLLAGCGFHLAGNRQLPEPLKSVFIDTQVPYSVTEPPVEAALRAIVRRRGGEVLSSQRAGAAMIRLSEINERREVLSVGFDGKAIEYQLITTLRYEVLRDGQPLVTPDYITASRDYSFQPQQVLAKEAEEARLREYIQNELAELVMLRLDAQLSRPPAVSPAAVPDAAIPAP